MIEHGTSVSTSCLPGENVHQSTFGSFTRTFSGTRADLWRLALDPIHALRPCVTDSDSGLALNYDEFTRHAAR
jgi:hypothetical protein